MNPRVVPYALGLLFIMAIPYSGAAAESPAPPAPTPVAYELTPEARLADYLRGRFPCGILRVEATDDQIIVELDTGREKGELFLCEVPIFESVTELKPSLELVPLNGRRGRVRLEAPRRRPVGQGFHDRLFSRWVIARKSGASLEAASHARYPDAVKPRADLPEERPISKKGLGGFSAGRSPLSDLDDLGIHSVTVNIVLDGLLRLSPGDGRLPFQFEGRTYFADQGQVAGLDKTMLEAARRHVIVSAIILVNRAAGIADHALAKALPHPDAIEGHFAMPNVNDPEGWQDYAAGLDFLASRYGRADGRYGRIHHWIMHNEVDAGWEWTNAGHKSVLLFMDLYQKSMRTAYYVARQYDAHAKVFISLTHFWNWTPDKHFYLPKEMLDLLLDFSRAEGDFDWSIAQHPYPQSLAKPRVWEDEQVDFTFNTPLITFKNIEVLDAWVRQPRAFYHGRPRVIHLTEQGLNSPDYSERSLQDQAAGMAYAWKKIERLNSIEAFDYHNWVDNRGEGGLRIGLRRFPDDRDDPLGKKPIWQVYQKLETPEEDQACEFAMPILNIHDWRQVCHRGRVGPGP